MKTTNKAILSVSIFLAIAAAAPSESATYKLKISRAESLQLKNATLVLKDESNANSSPNPLGSFSTGEPRYPYTFTVHTVSEADKLYELKGTVRQTHLAVNGDPRAIQLFDVPIGGDPIAIPNKTETRTRFLIAEQDGQLLLGSASNERGYNGFKGPGSWRACTSGTVDYQIYWFDGESA
jgi:hypothetical protein